MQLPATTCGSARCGLVASPATPIGRQQNSPSILILPACCSASLFSLLFSCSASVPSLDSARFAVNVFLDFSLNPKMSVLRHGGTTYLQRRLTKLYTDTKTSCESVTTASKAVDDPELVSLHRSFRTQRDRLLAWGLDWSDASAAQPNDIDESLTQAGFSDVVESVMSSIQEHLNEAERLQQTGASDLPRKTSQPDRPSKESLSALPARTHWTNEDIDCSRKLLAELTGCIDTLYDLSRSRRNMSSSGLSGVASGRARPSLGSKWSSVSDSKGYHNTYMEAKSPFVNQQQQDDFEYPPFSNTVPHAPAFGEHDPSYLSSPKSLAPSQSFVINRSALQLSGTSHDNSPPPYEVVAASANSRVIGRMRTSELPFFAGSEDSTISILVEYTPMMLGNQSAVTVPSIQRLEKVHRTLDQLVQNARVSHLGLLRFLGYYIDTPNSRYAFIYQMPIDYFPFLDNPTGLLNDLKPKPLVALLNAGDNTTIPNLETRFRLAYDLLMATLHLRSQNIVHGNINSSNILILPGLTNSTDDEVGITENLRRPHLTSFAQFSGDGPSPEPLSSSMYRHPDDKRALDDDAAWAYDLYSLGLVLLEIGLWTPVSRLWKMKYNNSMFKQRIESLYLQKLGPKCGTAYLNVVQLCLDAPNFHLSTQPSDDLKLRIPQTFHYPILDLSAPDSIFSFSMNFLYTMCKVAWSCCRMDLFSAPAAEELDDCLPLALVPEEVPAKEPASDYKHVFENPEFSTGSFPASPLGDMKSLQDKGGMDERKMKKRTFKKLTHVEIPQGHLNEWNMQIMPKLRKFLEKTLKDTPESCSATLMMTGDVADTAKPTICVTCSSVKRVRTALKKCFVVNKEDWDLIVIRGDIQRSKVPRNKRRRPARSGPEGSDAPSFPPRNLNPCYQEHPLCGASIGAFRNEEHLPPVSYGGAILVDGMPYGMTVHHMLEAPSDDEEAVDEAPEAPLRSAGTPGSMYAWREEDLSEADLEFEVSEDEDGDGHSFSQGLGYSYDEYVLSDDDSSDDEWADSDDAYEDEDAASIGDTAGIEPGEEPRQFVTQPAIDDVHEDFFPSPEDRDDEHLASHTLGYVHASSGVRRWTRKGIRHEIDWALIRINDSRTDARNIVFDNESPVPRTQGPSRQRRSEREPMPHEPIYLNSIARMEDLGGLQVHCCGRTSGLQPGQISKAMTLVKLHGRQSFSISFCVDGNFGCKFSQPPNAPYHQGTLTNPSLAPGDSGAWVFDKSTGHVCGHVVAWSERNHTAYIAPMDILLEDIARTLNANQISLPGNPDSSVAYALAQSASLEAQHARYHPAGVRIADQLPVDIGRLSIGVDGGGPVGSARTTSPNLREVSAPYQPMPLLTQPRSLERQLA